VRSTLVIGGRYHMLCFSDRQPGDWGPAGSPRTRSGPASAMGDDWTRSTTPPSKPPSRKAPFSPGARLSAEPDRTTRGVACRSRRFHRRESRCVQPPGRRRSMGMGPPSPPLPTTYPAKESDRAAP
jgi:hypothetical protein